MRRHNQKVYRVIRSILRVEFTGGGTRCSRRTYPPSRTSSYSMGSARFSTWLIRIAINEAYGRRKDALRVLQEQVPLERMEMPPDSNASPEERAASRELGRWLERAIDALPEIYRTAIGVLRDVDGLSTQEVASILDVSEDVVKTCAGIAREP